MKTNINILHFLLIAFLETYKRNRFSCCKIVLIHHYKSKKLIIDSIFKNSQHLQSELFIITPVLMILFLELNSQIHQTNNWSHEVQDLLQDDIAPKNIF